MSQKLQPVRGTHDILPDEARKRRAIEATLMRVAEYYGYGEIVTPVFEFSEVFHRTLGDTSDVVTKETYSFTDRGGDSLTLRPEFTAAVVRAFISNGLQDKLPFKVCYNGPAFRYERPQKGRLRQFHQFGVELLGEADPLADVEMIALADQCLTALGLKNHITLELNSLGDADSRHAYRSALVAYFKDHMAQLSEDSRQRLERNPLRILDSKDEGDRKLIANAPRLLEFFSTASKVFYTAVLNGLNALSIPYTLNPKLVRGLDYYSHTVFEFTTDKLGAQGTVLAGGRYDGLVKLMGGADVPGVGFASGIERLLGLMETVGVPLAHSSAKTLAVIPIDEAQETEALKLADTLRRQQFAVELLIHGNMGKKMKRAEKLGAAAVLILGENEVNTAYVTVKTMADGQQREIPRVTLADHLKALVHS